MPRALVDAEVAHRGLTELQVVPDMDERKRRLIDAGDALVEDGHAAGGSARRRARGRRVCPPDRT